MSYACILCYHQHKHRIIIFLWCLQWLLCDFIMNYRLELEYSPSRTNCFSCKHFRVERKKQNGTAEKTTKIRIMIMFIFHAKWNHHQDSLVFCLCIMNCICNWSRNMPAANAPLPIANKYAFMTPILMSDKHLLRKTDVDFPTLCCNASLQFASLFVLKTRLLEWLHWYAVYL